MSLQDPSLRHDLLTKEGVRSGGYGDALMDHVEEFARAAGCEKAALACGREREGAALLRAPGLREAQLRHAQGPTLRPVGQVPFSYVGTL